VTCYKLQITDYRLPPEGRAYKENVADTRESPVREMVKELKEFGIEVFGYDPLLSKEEIEAFGVNALDDMLQITDNILPIADRMDCVIVAVAHDAFRKMKLEDVKKFMNDKPVLIDVRGMFEGEEAIKIIKVVKMEGIINTGIMEEMHQKNPQILFNCQRLSN